MVHSTHYSRCWQTGCTCSVPSTFLMLGGGGVFVWGGGWEEECASSCVCCREQAPSKREILGVYLVCEWFVCVYVWARGSAAKTIICDRSVRDDSSLRDSLTPSEDQNRKKLTGRRVKVSEQAPKVFRALKNLTAANSDNRYFLSLLPVNHRDKRHLRLSLR